MGHNICNWCRERNKISVSTFCNGCGRILFKTNVVHFLVLMLLLILTGLSLEFEAGTLVTIVTSAVIVLTYMLVILRNTGESRYRFAVAFAFASAVVVCLSYPNGISLPKALVTWIICSIAIAYLLINYVLIWKESCRTYAVSYFEGFPAISLMCYLLTWSLPIGIQSLHVLAPLGNIDALISDKVFESLANVNDYISSWRELLVVAACLQIVFTALVAVVMRGMNVPKTLFEPTTKFGRYLLSKESDVQSFLMNLVRVMINSILAASEAVAYVLKSIANSLKLAGELVFKFFKNLALEVVLRIQKQLKVLYRTLYQFLTGDLLVLVLSTIMAMSLVQLSDNVVLFIRGSHFNLMILLQIAAIFITSILLAWSLTRESLTGIADAIFKSDVYFACILFVTMILASWCLWICSFALPKSHFRSLGGFTMFGSIAVAVLILGMFLFRIKKEKKGSE